jgi:nicotinate-nucleotide adenylyltransferase
MRLVSPNGRIGILGGTLDPIHLGHVEAARAAQRALALNPILVMPARMPPHRQQRPSVSMFHRFAMAALAVDGLENVLVSDDELCSDGPSYTALTLERLMSRGLHRLQTFFITGADAFAEIEAWHRYPEVLDLAHFVVVSRPGAPVAALADRLPRLRERFRDAAAGEPPAAGPWVFLVDAPTPDVSSTEIRRRIRAGESVSGLVPVPVERYLQRHGLYSGTPTSDQNHED